jgi:hypothetical protein
MQAEQWLINRDDRIKELEGTISRMKDEMRSDSQRRT